MGAGLCSEHTDACRGVQQWGLVGPVPRPGWLLRTGCQARVCWALAAAAVGLRPNRPWRPPAAAQTC